MAVDGEITAAELTDAVERAATYRRSLVEPGDGRNLDEAISGEVSTVARSRASMDSDGWVVAGMVFDTVADLLGHGLTVRWHTETDRVQVGRPATPP